MGERSPVLVPVDACKCQGRRRDLVSFWKAKGLLSGATNEEHDHWYLASDSSGAYPDICFDYVHVYDGGHRWLPAENTNGWGARCPHCSESLDEALFELREDWPDDSEDESTSMLDWSVTCPKCRTTVLLRDVPANAAMTPFYIHLGYGDLGDDDGAEFIADLQEFFGTRFNVLWLTL